jgi:hypothetical protein
MTPLTTIKVTLALSGIVLFGASIRFEAPALRWAAFGCFVVALLLRFMKSPGPGGGA